MLHRLERLLLLRNRMVLALRTTPKKVTTALRRAPDPSLRSRRVCRGPHSLLVSECAEEVTEPAGRSLLPATGSTVGEYILLAVIGAGGMATVYRARDRRNGRVVSVKLLHDELTGVRHAQWRLLHEALVLKRIRHPAIPRLIDVIDEPEPRRVAVVTELIPGVSLAEHLTDGPLSAADARFVLENIIDALLVVHRAGVVHRDVKPENILLTLDRDQQIVGVALLDFGISFSEAEARAFASRPRAAVGTPSYMAPEQIADDSVSPATDVYAVGELLYEMLTARRPFSGDPMDIMKAKLIGAIPDLDALSDASYVALIERCVQRKPAARPSLADVRSQMRDARPVPTAPSFGRMLMTAVSAGAVVGALLSWVRSRA